MLWVNENMADIRICPKCNYQRTANDDKIVPKGECPGCGIIYCKYIEKQSVTIVNEADEDGQSQQSTFSVNTSQGKAKYWYGTLTVMAILAFIIFMMRPEQAQDIAKSFSVSIPGTYTGKTSNNTIEFDVDNDFRVSKLAYTVVHGRDRQKVLWSYQKFFELKLSEERNKTRSYEENLVVQKTGQAVAIRSEPQGNGCKQLALDLSFNSGIIEDDTQELGLLNPAPNKESVYAKFDLYLPALGTLKVSHEEVNLPDSFSLSEINCCGAYRWLSTNGFFQTKPSDFQCASTHTFPFAYEIRFGISLHDSSKKIFRFISPHDRFDVSDDVTIAFPQPYTDHIQIVINNNGTGQAKLKRHTGRGTFFSVEKVGIGDLKEDPAKNEVNWDNCFPGEINKIGPVRQDMGKQMRDKAMMRMLEEMKSAGQEK